VPKSVIWTKSPSVHNSSLPASLLPAFVPKWASDAIESWEDSRRRDEAESAAERRMGA
jgi:hypothetical protein